ncbi:enolase [Canna indica]|uniref:phosphopyruvate hydratase n=1 Tax=Canna indica TaxID=4628 RepID=A0AAQ3KLG1_9LILI|nr:enolase [Canna indica]
MRWSCSVGFATHGVTIYIDYLPGIDFKSSFKLQFGGHFQWSFPTWLKNPFHIGLKRTCGVCHGSRVNQIGSVAESIEVVKMTKHADLGVMASHSSRQTEDTFIADHSAIMTSSLDILNLGFNVCTSLPKIGLCYLAT